MLLTTDISFLEVDVAGVVAEESLLFSLLPGPLDCSVASCVFSGGQEAFLLKNKTNATFLNGKKEKKKSCGTDSEMHYNLRDIMLPQYPSDVSHHLYYQSCQNCKKHTTLFYICCLE